MALNFPANPVDGQAFGNYTYNSSKGVWSASATPPRYTVSPNIPASAGNGDVWFNSETARSYIYYVDADTAQWVEIGGTEGTQGVLPSLGDAPDVDVTGLAGGDTLVYDSATSKWVPGEAGGKFTVSDTAPAGAENGDTWFKSDDGKTYIYYVDTDGGQWVEIASNTTGYLDIGQLNDVTIVSPTTGQALTYDGSGWVNATPASTLDSLTDVDTTGVADGQVLVYDSATSEWIPGSAAPSGVNVLASDTINIDFSDNVPLETRTVAGDVTFSVSAYSAGATKKISVTNNTGSPVLVSFPAGWKFLTDKPTKIGDGATNVIELESFGTTESGITARWYGPLGFLPYTASGGSVTTVEEAGVTYKVHTFSNTGVFNISELSESLEAEVLVVAGGGGGGSLVNNRAGGGGAGGLITIPNFVMDTVANYTVFVGSGGSAGASGSNSYISGGARTITASGGGRGGYDDTTDNALAGGSGGGNWYPGYPGAGATQSSTTSDGQTTYANTGFGNPGGTSGGSQPYAAGGGGAGNSGGNWNGASGPVGGNGLQISISGTPTYYAGGGSGSGYANDPLYEGQYAGGLGGGGRGFNASFNVLSNGETNTGSGGGSGGSGGSGIVIIRYPITNPN